MRRRHGSRGITRFVVALFLAIHAGLLAWQAYRYSPTIDEPAHMAAGISHWKFGRFDLYRVNPPLVRMIAALPMLIVEPKVDWSAFTEAAYARPEFTIGSALANGNGFDIFWDFTLARWACIPFSLIGGYFCYRWGRELYGVRPGIVALVLWCFCPNILGNGALITPDVPAAALGVTACYFFWHWLKACDNRFASCDRPLAACDRRLAVATRATEFAAPATAAHHLPSPRAGEGAGMGGRASRDPVQHKTLAAHPSTKRLAQSTANSSPLPLDGGGGGGGGAFRSPNAATQPIHSTDSNSTPAALNEYHTPTSPSSWSAALLAGVTLGLAELTKSTWIILFALYPAMSLAWTVCRGRRHAGPVRLAAPRLAQLATILALGLYILNLGYGFENTFQPLGKFAFISKTLGGPDAHEKPGNRFADTCLADIPVPVPANYLRGIDVQKYDFEKGKWSYLRGEHKFGGWWYYYLYAMGVKMPAGTLALIGLAFIAAIPWRAGWNRLAALRGGPVQTAPHPRSALIVLVPAIVVLVLISSQTGFSRYLRYAIPAFPFLFIFAGGLAVAGSFRSNRESADKARERLTVPATSNPRRVPGRSRRAYRALTAAAIPILLLASATSSLAVFPHNLSYFNELAGGPLNGAEHLLDANIDWGQDLTALADWHERNIAHAKGGPLKLSFAGILNAAAPGIPFQRVTASSISQSFESGKPDRESDQCGDVFAISVNKLKGYRGEAGSRSEPMCLVNHQVIGHVGYSLFITRVRTPN